MLKRVLIVALLLLLAASGADAYRRRGAPLRVRIVAYVNEKVEGSRPDFTWPVTCRGKRYELYVLNLTVLGGRATPLDIDAAVSPYSVKFQVTGDKTVLDRFVAAPPRQQILMTGILRLDPAGRYLLLDAVEGASPATPSPAAQSPGQ